MMGSSDYTNNIKIKFGPKSAIVKQLKEDKNDRFPWKCGGDSIAFEFAVDSNAPYKSMNANLLAGLERHRSSSFAEDALGNMAFALRHSLEIPRMQTLLLADALDRVREEGKCVHFLYGVQAKSGRPEKDILLKFQIFKVIESLNTTCGRLATSRRGLGAYEAAEHILKQMDIYIESDELRRIRQQVLSNAKTDINYLMLLVAFFEREGYVVKQCA